MLSAHVSITRDDINQVLLYLYNIDMPEGRDIKAEDIDKIILELDEVKQKLKYVIIIMLK